MRLAKEEVAKRIAGSTNSSKIVHVSESTSNSSNTDNEITATAADRAKKYNIGDYVRCTYDEDGVDYEAQIIEIDNDSCLIRYIGFNNEEWVFLNDLVASWGKKERKKQLVSVAGSENHEKSKSNAKKQNHSNEQNVRNLYQRNGMENVRTQPLNMPQMPPMPPMPPMLEEMSEDSEHLSAMLMSWYMNGYYTGLYHGRKQARLSN